MNKVCLNCSIEFDIYPYRAFTAKYCSRKCRQIHFMKDPEYRAKTISVLPHKKGKNHPQWVGEDITYIGLHVWLRNNFAKSGICSKCQKKTRTTWANRTGKYKRDIKDWLELCYKCHWHFDREEPKKHRYENFTKR